MGDYSEEDFEDVVEPVLHDWFGEGRVERQHYFPATGRRADFVVSLPMVTLAVEVEDTTYTLHESAGQARLYANHLRYGVPVVVVPHDTLDQPEAQMLSSHVNLVPMEPPAEGS